MPLRAASTQLPGRRTSPCRLTPQTATRRSTPTNAGIYTKCVRQASPGKVDLAAYKLFRRALDSGHYADFEAVPSAALAHSMDQWRHTPTHSAAPTAASSATLRRLKIRRLITSSRPPRLSPAMPKPPNSSSFTGALSCAVPFTDYPQSPVAQDAAKELSSAPPLRWTEAQRQSYSRKSLSREASWRNRRTLHLAVPAREDRVRRASHRPAICLLSSRHRLHDGSQYLERRAKWHFDWLPKNQSDPTLRYLYNGRALAAWTHVDVLFQAYCTALLVLQSVGAPLNP